MKEKLVQNRQMNSLTLDDVRRMIQAIRDLHENTAEYLNKCEQEPLPDSLAAQELNTFENPESLITAYSQGSILIEVAADQLMAFTRVLVEPVQTIAPWTCVRSATEACALAVWLLDPNIDARTRVQRSFAFRYEGLSQQVKFANASGDEDSATRVGARIDKVEKDALGLGFQEVKNRRGKRIGIAQEMPNVTTIIVDALDEEALYRLLSAAAHAHPWVLQQLSFQRIEGGESYFVENDGKRNRILHMEKSLTPIAVAYLCAKVINVFGKPLQYKCQLFGWDIESLNDILSTASASIFNEGSG